ncbi:MAG: hypothetical protein PHC88_06995 [Terrimicrobiaceae bacterium]|nr:hypothetical protein [Terrimicrobiaceae bacterium]
MPRWTPISLALLALLAGAATAQPFRQPPTPAERAYAAKVGWAAAADQIGKTLRAAYQPGRAGTAGSVGNEAFQSWLLLYRWSELLSRRAPDELARFLGQFFFVDPESERPSRITFVPPGEAPPGDLQPVSAANLKALAADPEALRPAVSRLLPATFQPGSDVVADGLRPDFLAAMAGDEAFLRIFFANLSDRDFAPIVLKTLEQIWVAERAKWPDYRNLAIAIALVRDEQPPDWWPHRQVRHRDVPPGPGAPLDEFRFWVASNEGKRLFTDLRRLEPEELKFVVDAPIAASELEWAQKNVRFPRADFGRAFSSIAYRERRLEAQSFTWSDGPYTLAAIRENGGICVDQAYFAMLSGKAHGLPTLYFTGQGSDGGHAWFGYMKSENRWDMDCGRYENQNYAVGEALDPQTWLPINDHELASLAQSFRRTPDYLDSQADLAMARLFERSGDSSRALAALDSAISVCPPNDLAWSAKGDFLDRSGAAPAIRQAFHEEAIKQFVNNDDLKVSHQRALAALARGAGDEAAAQALESQIISQNRRSRSDLSVNAAAARLGGLVDAKNFDDAMREYRSLLGRLGRTSGGNFFYEIVEPFTHALVRNGDTASARRAVDLARAALRPEGGSILDQELTSLAGDISTPAGAR